MFNSRFTDTRKMKFKKRKKKEEKKKKNSEEIDSERSYSSVSRSRINNVRKR